MSDVQYPNRTDLQNPARKLARQAAKGQTYGKAKEQMDAQRAVPMAAPEAPQRAVPGQFGKFNRSTERPNEPGTQGASFGPGFTPPNRVAMPRAYDPVFTELAALYEMFPSEELADMLDSYLREGY